MQLPINPLEPKPSRFAWLSHVPPVVSTLLALAMLVLTPVWAVGYYHQPFAGVLLEPNNIVSKIIGKNWPASQAGAVWPEQLVKLGDMPVKNVQQVNAFLANNGNAALWMEFVQRSGTARDVANRCAGGALQQVHRCRRGRNRTAETPGTCQHYREPAAKAGVWIPVQTVDTVATVLSRF